MKYLALGDSYTIGEGVEEKGTYPYLLQQFLKTQRIDVDVTVIAKTGWTAQELFDVYSNQILKREYDLVTLLVGVNNQYRNHDFSYFKKGFEKMLNEAISKSKNGESNVFVLSIPNYSLTPFGKENQTKITEEIEQYNNHIQVRCGLYGVHFVDLVEVYNTNASSFVVSDNLHPSTEMYELWTNCFEKEVLSILS